MLQLMLCLLIVSLLMSSCATILNRPHKYVTVHTTEPSQIIHWQDTINTIDNKAHLKVYRSWLPLLIVATTDNLTKRIGIESRNSAMYWANIPFNYGLGMLIDRNNPKRYTYPGKIFINSADATGRYSMFGKANNKGELYLHLSLPFINPFRMMPENEGVKNNVGIIGINFGLDYYHSRNQFIHFGFSTVSGGSRRTRIPTTSPYIIRLRENEHMSTDYFSISNNHKIRRFTIGYGISYAKNNWRYNKSGWAIPHILIPIPLPFIIDEVEKNHNAFGLIFPSHYQIGEYFHIGLVYRPTFFRPNIPEKFLYEHLISIELAWKIRLKR